MKRSLQVLPFLILVATANAREPVRLTKDLLAQKGRSIAASQNNHSKNITKKTFASSSQNHLQHSTILASHGSWTFIPKGSVINIPKNLREKIVAKPDGKFVPFPKFLRSNIAWLNTRELKQEELLGNIEDPETFFSSIKNDLYLTIATSDRAPVSTVFELK